MVGGVFRGFSAVSLFLFFPRLSCAYFMYAYGVVRVPPTTLDRSEFPTMLKSILFIWIIE